MRKLVTVQIEGYLVQSKLSTALQTIVGDAEWRGNEIRVPGTRYRWDMAYQRGRQLVFVEFDGEAHYRNSLTIKADSEKDIVAKTNGHRVVRIPYWVQLTTKTLKYYFDLDAEIIQDFPHGFISKKNRMLPASFCELGIARFQQELDDLPVAVKDDVLSSLRDRANEYDRKYVLPKKLHKLLKGMNGRLASVSTLRPGTSAPGETKAYRNPTHVRTNFSCNRYHQS